jgi:hypothetical protein
MLDDRRPAPRILSGQYSVSNPIRHLPERHSQYIGFIPATNSHLRTLFARLMTLLIVSGPAGVLSLLRAIQSLCLILKNSSLSRIVSCLASSSASISSSLVILPDLRGRMDGGGNSGTVGWSVRTPSRPPSSCIRRGHVRIKRW